MKPVRTLAEAGSGCCLLLPLIGLAATAAEPVPDFQDLSVSASSETLPLVSDELPLPAVGFEAVEETVSDSFLGVEGNQWDTLDLNEYGVGDLVVETSQQLLLPFEAAEETLTIAVTDEIITEPSISEQPVLEAYEQEAIAVVEEAATFGALMVDLQTDERRPKVATLVKGAEDGKEAIALNQWLVPFDDVVRAFGLGMTMEADGEIGLRSPEIATQVSLESFQTDIDLGKVWSVDQIEAYLGATAEFDRANYAIKFNQDTVQSIQAEHKPSYPTHTLASSVSNVIEEVAALDTAVPDIENSEATTDSLETTGEQLTLTLDVEESVAEQTLGVLLVGLAVDELTTVEATLIKGAENGQQAIAFDQWLIPFDDAMVALGGSITPQPDGLLEVRAPGLATMIDPEQLPNDPELGLSISIGEIEKSLGIPAEFSFTQYAVRFMPPVMDSPLHSRLNGPAGREAAQPVALQELPAIAPAPFGISGLRQSAYVSGTSNSDGTQKFNQPTGQLSAVGTALGGSWYTAINQPALSDYSSWQIRELQYLRQGATSDYVLGSQPTFWQAHQQESQDYWGLTTVQRWGFTSPTPNSQGGFSPSTRLQSNQIGRTVAGEATPGTLVQLKQGINGLLIDEVVVNSSGLYRFEDVPARGALGGQYSNNGYQVQLYPNGQLTQEPEIRSAQFTTLPGQLPKGASALIASVGMNRELRTQRIFGEVDGWQGGLSYRRGVSESLTLGAGLVQGDGTQVLTEAFYLPKGFPLQAAVSAVTDTGSGQTRVNADVRYQPAKNLKMTFRSDRFSQRFATDWRVSPGFTLSATGNTREKSLALRARANYSVQRWHGSATATVDTRQNLRWGINANNGRLRMSHRGSEISTYSSLSYRLPQRRNNSTRNLGLGQLGHELTLGYETRRAYVLNDFGSGLESSVFNLPAGRLAIAQWRYRSLARTADGNSRWNIALGYGVGSEGSGPIASGAVALTPGMDLQMRYQGISAFSDTNSFQISLTSRLRNRHDDSEQMGWGDREQNRLRTQGGVVLQPFLDDNANGQWDAQEPLYLDSPELMMLVNHKTLTQYRHDVQSDGILLTLPPDTYRLDLDPAGLPLDRTTGELAYAVEVVPGQYTSVPVPLTLSYSVSGVVIDADRQAVAGARVEAVSSSGHRQISITNGAGVYYLERLQPERYELRINGDLIEQESLSLEGETEPFLERELHLL